MFRSHVRAMGHALGQRWFVGERRASKERSGGVGRLAEGDWTAGTFHVKHDQGIRTRTLKREGTFDGHPRTPVFKCAVLLLS